MCIAKHKLRRLQYLHETEQRRRHVKVLRITAKTNECQARMATPPGTVHTHHTPPLILRDKEHNSNAGTVLFFGMLETHNKI